MIIISCIIKLLLHFPQDIFMHVVNLEDYGHLVDASTFSVEKLHPDLWQMVSNKEDWEARYLHPLYYHARNISTLNDMPCPDVYWFPVFSETFCEHLVETMNDSNEWSGGKNSDARVPGGYENVPTDDTHMTQIGYQDEGKLDLCPRSAYQGKMKVSTACACPRPTYQSLRFV